MTKYQENLITQLQKLAKRSHYYCEDGWYSCPKAIDGCANDAVGDDCNCGAEEQNKKIDELIQKLKNELNG